MKELNPRPGMLHVSKMGQTIRKNDGLKANVGGWGWIGVVSTSGIRFGILSPPPPAIVYIFHNKESTRKMGSATIVLMYPQRI